MDGCRLKSTHVFVYLDVTHSIWRDGKEEDETKNEKKVLFFFFGSTFKDPATMMHNGKGGGGLGGTIPHPLHKL